MSSKIFSNELENRAAAQTAGDGWIEFLGDLGW